MLRMMMNDSRAVRLRDSVSVLHCDEPESMAIRQPEFSSTQRIAACRAIKSSRNWPTLSSASLMGHHVTVKAVY